MDKSKTAWGAISASKELALHYMTTLTEVAREPLLILDADLRVTSANPMFYQDFQVAPEQTEDKLLYKLGNGQWNIPELRKLLEEILPEQKIVRNYQVNHVFEKIGRKIMLLNARQIDSVQLIILAIEDITDRKILEEKISANAKELARKVAARTKKLTDRIKELEAMNKVKKPVRK